MTREPGRAGPTATTIDRVDDTRAEAAPAVVHPDRWVRRAVVPFLVLCTVVLFLPWSVAGTPAADLRSELVIATALLVVLGAVALAVPSRWSSALAAAPALVHLSDLGPVLYADTGTSWVLRAVVVVGSLTGTLWVGSALLRSRRAATAPPWLLVPVGMLLALASLALPWAVVSDAGTASGTTSAWALIAGAPAELPAGVAPTRLVLLLLMVAAVVAAVVPIFVTARALENVAVLTCLVAAVGLVALQLYMAGRADAVVPAVDAPGLRVALAGLVVAAVAWSRPPATEPALVADLPVVPLDTDDLAA